MTKEAFLNPTTHGFFRVAVGIPRVYLGNPEKNVEEHLELLKEFARSNVDYAIFPELGITGYSCRDLFHNQSLIQKAKEALLSLVRISNQTTNINPIMNKFMLDKSPLFTVGVPLEINGRLYNTAVTISSGKILSIVPKSYPPSYRQFEEERYFAPADELGETEIELQDKKTPVGTKILLRNQNNSRVII